MQLVLEVSGEPGWRHSLGHQSLYLSCQIVQEWWCSYASVSQKEWKAGSRM